MSTNDLAAAVEQARAERGWTQRDLSARSSVSLTTISAIERRSRDHFQIVTLNALDQAFGWASGTLSSIAKGDERPTGGVAAATKTDTRTTFRLEGRLTSQASVRHEHESISIGTLEALDGTSYTITQVVRREGDSPDLGGGAKADDYLIVTITPI